MAQAANQIEVYLEIGQTRTFAVALDWPGWCRSGRDEAAALQALYEYGPRYARALQTTRLRFRALSEASALVVVERLRGNATRRPSQTGGYAAFGSGTSVLVIVGYHRSKVPRKSLLSTWVRTWSSRCAPFFVQRICCFLT